MENERDYALAKVEIAKTQMRVEHVKVPTYYEKCDSCDKYWLERQIEKQDERYKKQRSFLRAFEVLVAIVIVFTAYQEEAFWKDFKQFFLGLWKVMCVVGIAVYNGYSSVSGFITGGIQNATVQSALYWILLVLLLALTVGGLYLLFRWMWNESKEKLMKAGNPYTAAIIIFLLLVVVYLGEFVKLLLPINLVGLWLLGMVVIPFWLIGIFIIKRYLLNIKPKTKPVSNLNFMVIVGAGLVGIVLLSGLIILVLGIIRAEIFMIFFGGFFVFGGLVFVLGALTIMGRFDKYKIDVLGLYVGILFVFIGIGFPAIKCRETQSLSETIQAFGLWILIPIMMTVVGVLQIVKCLKNRG